MFAKRQDISQYEKDEPDLDEPIEQEYYQAFIFLQPSRVMEGPIPLSEIEVYFRNYPVTDDAMTFIDTIRIIDLETLKDERSSRDRHTNAKGAAGARPAQSQAGGNRAIR